MSNNSTVYTNITSDVHVHIPPLDVKIQMIGCWIRSSLIPFICFSNILIFVSVLKFPHLRTCSNALICSMAAADLLTGGLLLPVLTLPIIYGSKIYMNENFCMFKVRNYHYFIINSMYCNIHVHVFK